MSNSLDPDQDRHSVGPDLGPNCLQRLSPDDKVTAFKLMIKGHLVLLNVCWPGPSCCHILQNYWKNQ